MKVLACLASSLDGKITAAHTTDWTRLGSDADLEHLFKLRDQADALIFGASTFRSWPKIRLSANKKLPPPQPVVLTQSWNLDLEAEMFQDWHADWPKILIASPNTPPHAICKALSDKLDWLPLPEGLNAAVASILSELRRRGYQRVMIEGGGEILAMFLEAKAVDDLYLTLTPWLIGGERTPSLVTGNGFALGKAPQSEILNVKQVDNEIYLHLKLHYSDML